MILDFMRNDHRKCDHFYTDAEAAAMANDLENAKKSFSAFAEATYRHFTMEEDELFPAFEQRTGMTSGPTQVMRYEHQQLRSLIEKMQNALENNNLNDFFGVGESMMIMLQQHNMKEEQMLYPMADRALGADSQLMVNVLQGMKEA